MLSEIIKGQQTSWTLIRKLGEGDAGEVYLVQALVGERRGVLKRPQRSAYAGDVVRQATQIKLEGGILRTIAGTKRLSGPAAMRAPELLDMSKPGAEFSERMFIVIEQARGFDLSFLMRTSRMGIDDQKELLERISPEEFAFLHSIAENGQIPDFILLNCLDGLLQTIDRIHTQAIELNGVYSAGLIYNDVKPDHLFWDPVRSEVILIDWGNSQLLDPDGMSRDRHFSTRNDYVQFVEEMGRFLAAAAPDLRRKLEWPVVVDFTDDTPESAGSNDGGLRERIRRALQEENERVAAVRQRQARFLQPANASEEGLWQLDEIHKELLRLGEIPDYAGALHFAEGYATQLILADLPGEVQKVCSWVFLLPFQQSSSWRLVARLAQICERSRGDLRQFFLSAMQSAVCGDGAGVLWHLLEAVRDAPEPNWWDDLVGQARQIGLGVEKDALLPRVAVTRLGLSIQADIRRAEDEYARRKPTAEEDGELSKMRLVLRNLQDDILGTWGMVDPPPPNAFLDYDDLVQVQNVLAPRFAEENMLITRLLNQPRAQVGLVLDAWGRKDFLAASQALLQVAIWDPDRRRLLRARTLLELAPAWIKRVNMGPHAGENFVEFITDLEFSGRELRNHIGPAGWLDSTLEHLGRLRKGMWPADLLASAPMIIREMPWLRRFERVERLPANVLIETVDSGLARNEPASAKTDTVHSPSPQPELYEEPLVGIRDGRLGPDADLRILAPLDAWAPEARGSSARVYLGEIASGPDTFPKAAVKLMRMDKTAYALPLFREEVQILALMDGIPGVNRMLECGFIKMNREGSLPLDSELAAIRSLSGAVLRIGPDSARIFIEKLDERVDQGWTPYLAIQKRENDDNLLYLCDSGILRGQYLPLIQLLQMAVQICDILQAAHNHNVVYRDHKILHYYWQKDTNGLYVIDWNVARYHPGGLDDLEKQMDLVQFGARGLHHILTGRAAPGALPLGPTRPEDIEQAAKSYRTQWTYDDQRLSQKLRDIIEAVLAGAYTSATQLREDLKSTYMQFPFAGE